MLCSFVSEGKQMILQARHFKWIFLSSLARFDYIHLSLIDLRLYQIARKEIGVSSNQVATNSNSM